MKRKIISLFLLTMILCMSCFFTGCSDKKLYSKEIIVNKVERNIPNAKFVKMEHKENDDEFGKNVYTFSVGDFEFDYRNYMASDSIFGFETNQEDNNYLERLILYKYDDICKIAKENNLYLFDEKNEDKSKLDEMLKQPYKQAVLRIDTGFVWTNGWTVDFYLSDFSQIENCYDFLEDLREVLVNYMPNEEFDFALRYRITREDIKGKEQFKGYFYSAELEKENDFEIAQKWTEYEYAYLVREFVMSDKVLTYGKAREYKPLYIKNLYINGEKFTSEKYSTTFAYNVAEDKYYTVVSYGSEFEYNGGVKDYLQREIIEKYYPESNYKINDNRDYSTYKIGNDDYKVVYKKKYKDFVFYKNGKEIKIRDYLEIGPISSGATYNKFISAEDFADLMGMKVEKIDTNSEECAVYLKTK